MGLPSKHSSDPILLTFRVKMGTGVFKLTWPMDSIQKSLNDVPRFFDISSNVGAPKQHLSTMNG